jgi:tetratricopeptide (TPR) repeat protein
MATLARSYDATNRQAEALELYNQLIPLVPQIPEYINNRGVIYFNTLRRYPEAKADFERARFHWIQIMVFIISTCRDAIT